MLNLRVSNEKHQITSDDLMLFEVEPFSFLSLFQRKEIVAQFSDFLYLFNKFQRQISIKM